MIEKMEITKKESTIEIFVKIKKKTGRRIPVMVFSWVNAKEILSNKFSDLVIKEPLEKKGVLDNTKQIMEDTWVFPFHLKEQPKKVEEKKEELQEVIINPKRNNIKIVKQKDKLLTKQQEAVTVGETEQSDLPVIVQEPTE